VALSGIVDKHCGQSLVVGTAVGAGFFSRLTCMTSRKITKAIIMKLPAASCGVSCEILRSRYPPSPRLRRVLLAFIPAAAYSAEATASAAKAGSYGVFGEGE
jgi:hypothetical protein